MSNVVTVQPERRSVIGDMAARFGMESLNFERTLRATVFPREGTPEQFAAFLLVAKHYDLNPITKELYAFPARGGGIVPIVSIDGWLKLINLHPQFDGMEFEDAHDASGDLFSTKCTLWRKDRTKPIIITEYLSECYRPTESWKMKHRMLRHKALIQTARYAFGFSGIYDPDEGERIVSVRENALPRAPAPTAAPRALAFPNPNKPAGAPPQGRQSAPVAFDMAAFRAAIDAASDPDERNSIYEREVAPRNPPLTPEELDEIDELMRRATTTTWTDGD